MRPYSRSSRRARRPRPSGSEIFVEKAAQATSSATCSTTRNRAGAAELFPRALNCGAITEPEAVAKSGLTLDELRSDRL